MFGWFSAASTSRFALKAREPIRIAGHRGGQDFDRDRPLEIAVARAIHLAHAARADRRGDFVDAEPRARGERQCRDYTRGAKLDFYSARRTAAGSIRKILRAGMAVAIVVATSRMVATIATLHGPDDVHPNTEDTTRDSSMPAATVPRVTPTAASAAVVMTSPREILRGAAPRAKRMPTARSTE